MKSGHVRCAFMVQLLRLNGWVRRRRRFARGGAADRCSLPAEYPPPQIRGGARGEVARGHASDRSERMAAGALPRRRCHLVHTIALVGRRNASAAISLPQARARCRTRKGFRQVIRRHLAGREEPARRAPRPAHPARRRERSSGRSRAGRDRRVRRFPTTRRPCRIPPSRR